MKKKDEEMLQRREEDEDAGKRMKMREEKIVRFGINKKRETQFGKQMIQQKK